MKKIVLLASFTFLFFQCKKQNELPALANDNDYKTFDLIDRVCEINQKVTLLEKTNFSIDDQNGNYVFNEKGYLISNKIFNTDNQPTEENTFEKLALPLTKKQFITADNFIFIKTEYDSVKNITRVVKTTNKNQIVDEQRNTLSNDRVIREDYYISGNNKPIKVIKIDRNEELIKNKVILSQTNKILDSIVYDYKGNKIKKEIHYNANKEVVATEIFDYVGENISKITYLNAQGAEDAIEKIQYNKNNDIVYKYTYSKEDNSTYEEIYHYNIQNKIQAVEVKLNDKLISKSNYTYNDKNSLIRFEMTNLLNNENFEKTYNYTYDKKNNWLTKEVSVNKTPIYKVSREIKYCK